MHPGTTHGRPEGLGGPFDAQVVRDLADHALNVLAPLGEGQHANVYPVLENPGASGAAVIHRAHAGFLMGRKAQELHAKIRSDLDQQIGAFALHVAGLIQQFPKVGASLLSHARILRLKEQIAMIFRWPNGAESAIENGLRRNLSDPLLRRWAKATRKGAFAAAATLSASLFLTACTTPSEPKIRTVEIKVPVVQACLTKDLNLDPQFPDSDAALRASAGAGDMLQLLAAGRLLRIQTMAEWKAALLACR